MATDESTDILVLLDVYLETATALVGLARTGDNPDSFDQIVASVRRTCNIAGSMIRELPDGAARNNLSAKHAKLAGMLDEVCSGGLVQGSRP